MSCVMANQSVSDKFTRSMGMRQGENLSPLLFTYYVNDLQEYLLDNGNFLDFCENDVNTYLRSFVLMYADDTVILCDSVENTKQALIALHNYCNDWKLNVNCGKTKMLYFVVIKFKSIIFISSLIMKKLK